MAYNFNYRDNINDSINMDPLTGLAVGAGASLMQGAVNTFFGNEAGHQARKTFRSNANYQNMLNRQNAMDKYQLELAAMRNAGISESALGGKMSDAGVSPVNAPAVQPDTYAGNIGQNIEKVAEIENLNADADLKESQAALNGQQMYYNSEYFPKHIQELQARINEINSNRDLNDQQRLKLIADTYRTDQLTQWELVQLMNDNEKQKAFLERYNLQTFEYFLELPANVIQTYLGIDRLRSEIDLNDARIAEAFANVRQLGALAHYWDEIALSVDYDNYVRRNNLHLELESSSNEFRNTLKQQGIDSAKLDKLLEIKDFLAEKGQLLSKFELLTKLDEYRTLQIQLANEFEQSQWWSQIYNSAKQFNPYDLRTYNHSLDHLYFFINSVGRDASQFINIGLNGSRSFVRGANQVHSVSEFLNKTPRGPVRNVQRYDDYGNKVSDTYNPLDFPNAKYGHPRSK